MFYHFRLPQTDAVLLWNEHIVSVMILYELEKIIALVSKAHSYIK